MAPRRAPAAAAALALALALLAPAVRACTINNQSVGATNFDCFFTAAALETENVVPAQGGANTWAGAVDLLWGATKMCWQLSVPSYPLPTGCSALAVYKGLAGSTGTSYLSLWSGSDLPIGGCVNPLSDAFVSQLFTNPSSYYTQLTCSGWQARGQIVTEPRLYARLEATLETPASTGAAAGNAFVDLFWVFIGNSYSPQICYNIVMDASIPIGTVSTISIWPGGYNQSAGTQLVRIITGATAASTISGCTKSNTPTGYAGYPLQSGNIANSVEFFGMPARIAPLSYFVDIRTTGFTKGVARGQLMTKVPLTASLSGSGGSASVKLVLGNGGIKYTLTASGSIGTPLELRLTDTASPPTLIIKVGVADLSNLSFATSGYANVPSQETITNILRAPTSYQVTLHTLEYLTGAMSGTLNYVSHANGGQCCNGT
eukprot:SM000130S27091  [mRNA]  locus=s130:128724:131589:+ [translate_table: standard]